MTLGTRKLVIIGLVGLIVLAANIMVVAAWLNNMGVVELAGQIRHEFLTGTAITILVALLILLVGPPRGDRRGLIGRCSVCGHRSLGGRYCSDCGSRL